MSRYQKIVLDRILIKMKDARVRISMMRYLDTRVWSVECQSSRHLKASLRTIVLDATVDLLLSHGVMGSFFLQRPDYTPQFYDFSETHS